MCLSSRRRLCLAQGIDVLRARNPSCKPVPRLAMSVLPHHYQTHLSPPGPYGVGGMGVIGCRVHDS